MAPARGLLLRRHCNSYGSFSLVDDEALLRPIPVLTMAEKIETTTSPSGSNKELEEEIVKENQEVGSSASKLQGEESYEGWLQLGIGTGTAGSGSWRPSGDLNLGEAAAPFLRGSSSSSLTPRKRGRSTELELLPPPPPSMLMPPPLPGGVLSTGGYIYGLGVPASPSSSAASSSTASLPMPYTHGWGQFVYHQPESPSSSEAAGLASETITTTTTRVVRPPPPRPQAGVWCKLEAAQNQVKEPFLPQIPKSYLRTKYLDGTMTVNLLLKYLANKLGLEDESKVEITCRGQQLPPYLTLQHIRDNIWRPSEIIELQLDSGSTDHIMTLHYSRK